MTTLWRHKKTGDVYVTLLQTALLERDLTPVVVYAKLPKGTEPGWQQGMMLPPPYWVRPVDEFLDGRFQQLTDEEAEKHRARSTA